MQLLTTFRYRLWFRPRSDVKFFWISLPRSIFVCLWQILSNYKLTRVKRFISRFTGKLCNIFFVFVYIWCFMHVPQDSIWRRILKIFWILMELPYLVSRTYILSKWHTINMSDQYRRKHIVELYLQFLHTYHLPLVHSPLCPIQELAAD